MSISYLIVFGGYLAFLTWTCLKSMKEVESLSDFTTGGHRMGLLLGVGTSVATWVSVASVMGVPGQLYRTGVAAIIGWVAGDEVIASGAVIDGPMLKAEGLHLRVAHTRRVAIAVQISKEALV